MSSSSTFVSFIVIFFVLLATPSLRVTIAGREIPPPPKVTSPKQQPGTFNGYDRSFLIPGIGRVMVPPLGGQFMVPPLGGQFMVPPLGVQFMVPPLGGQFLVPPLEGQSMVPPPHVGQSMVPPPHVGQFMVPPPHVGQFMAPPFGNAPTTSAVRNSLSSSSGGNGVEAPNSASGGSPRT